ncbi:Tetrapyrrole biosynthesis, hydroxymethylbilane synthase, partial [mine drainage metagenome]
EVETPGDRDREAPIYTMGGTGVFVSTLNEKILSGEIDVAVHSAKDIPTSIPGDIEIAGVLERGPVEDLLVSRAPLERIPKGSVVGTSSLRRSHEILFARPDLKVKSIRGNVDTRIRKYVEGQYDAIILAKAAYDRLGLDENAYVLDVHS